MKQRTWKSKIFSAIASVGAAAMLLGTAVPTFASATKNWDVLLGALRAQTYITGGSVSGQNAKTYSVWLDDIDAGRRGYFWAANVNGVQIGNATLLPKNDGGMASTLSYNETQHTGNSVRLYGRTESLTLSTVHAEGRVNFG